MNYIKGCDTGTTETTGLANVITLFLMFMLVYKTASWADKTILLTTF